MWERLKMQKVWNEAVKLDSRLVYKLPGKLLANEMCQNAVKDSYWRLKNVHDQLKMAKMCNGVVKDEAIFLGHVPDCLNTEEICNEAVHREPYTLGYVPDYLKTEEVCEKAVKKDPWSMRYVPDRFVTYQQILWVMKPIIGRHCMFDDLIEWYEDYKK